ncbi:hypothetical protein OG889_43640 [Streptomyces sp. NBC_00481]|jgi:hypothetical protein|uniref:hypothetical protein n=1 Tax=unclassified Streptomyces TaxID=2593676 RepID=UPI002DD7CA30|nr:MULTISPECIES: hypothetical protein [unclassified Streptomyces]WRZ00971.1 hypothetical protein OG889_43640 [Streptomyces sp. NBC_00481]
MTGSGAGTAAGVPRLPSRRLGERLRHRKARKVLHSRTTTPPQDESDTAKVGAGK